jgi:hypothetical protein
VIGVVPDAITVVGVVDASPYTIQAYESAGPPSYTQFQVGFAEVEPCTPANENDVIVTIGAATGGAVETGGIMALMGVSLYNRWITVLDTYASVRVPGGGTKENVEGPIGINPDSGRLAGRGDSNHLFSSGRSLGLLLAILNRHGYHFI